MTEADSLSSLTGLMGSAGVEMSPAEFHSIVNTVFHEFEAAVYDEIHGAMWRSLAPQFNLLASDAEAALATIDDVSLIDIGCGTGMATDLFLKSPLGRRVKTITMLDTSEKMLELSRSRAAQWRADPTFVHGTLSDVPVSRPFHVAVVSSVLHHIPDLAGFCRELSDRQMPGGVFLHLQDPNSGISSDPQFRERVQVFNRWRYPSGWRRLTPSRLIRRMRTTEPDHGYIGLVNAKLVREGVVRRALTPSEIWRVTDLHVYDGGLSADTLRGLLLQYEPLKMRTYAFYGVLRSELPADLARTEDALTTRNDMTGAQLAGAWRRKP